MTTQKTLAICFVAITFLTLSGAKSFAGSMIAEDKVKDGKAFYEEGDYQRAIHEFSKALLVDPNNKEAREYLHKMGLEDGIYGRQNPPLKQITEMSTEIKGYKATVSDLEKDNQAKDELAQSLQAEKDNLAAMLQAQKDENAAALAQAEKIKQAADERVDEVQKQAQNVEQASQARIKEIVRLHTDLYALKDRVLKAENTVRTKEQQWLETKAALKDRIKTDTKKKLEYERKMLAMEEEYNLYKHQTLQSDLETKRQIEELQDNLRDRVSAVDYAQDRLAVTGYKLSETQAELADREKRLMDINAHLADTEGGVSFLEQKLREQRGKPDEPQVSEDQETISEQKNFLLRQDRLIVELKEKLVAAREELQSIGKDTGAKSSPQDEIQKQLASANTELEKTKTSLNEKSEAYTILEQRLNDLQDRLSVVEGLLQTKDEQIKQLEGQLTPAAPPATAKP